MAMAVQQRLVTGEQLVDARANRAAADAMTTRAAVVPAVRGRILAADGSVLVTATTPCTAGDRYALSDRLFGEKALPGQGYLPTEESPSDPLFFGITPGEPQFSSAG